jgi:hypothetical protein
VLKKFTVVYPNCTLIFNSNIDNIRHNKPVDKQDDNSLDNKRVDKRDDNNLGDNK